ncbi:MAG: PKD domain-containing protein, partial [Candidatus Cloacimonetes bacterium]|nr:PKD domain-containing protein [Candidatus Cloacimonadota bacterium]
MKKIFIIIAIMIVTISISAGIRYENNSDRVRIIFDNNDYTECEENIFKVVALPSRNAEIIVNSCEVSVFSNDGDLLESKTIRGDDKIDIEHSFVMRDLFAHQLKINVSESNNETKTIIKKLDFEIVANEIERIPDRISKAFLPIYRSIVDNFDRSYLRNASVLPSKMLIITHDNASLLSTLQYFTDWKNAKGISTEIAKIEDIGSTSEQIKTYIQNIYDTQDYPPDYILLIGDFNGAYAISSFFISSGSENNVTDHPFTLLNGDDYFPEMIIGRMSVDTPMEFQTIISKVLHYEKQPYMESTHWFQNACLVAGNYSSSPPTPSTPVKVTKWLRDKMLNYGYNQIDEIYYDEILYPNYPGTDEIISSINSGVGFVTYRGWGDANGWHYPYFHSENIDELNNGFYLPVICSYVCNSGDFANTVDPCLGEKWLTAGTPTSPQGGVVFIGPSDLHTKTKLNNSIFSGFFAGLLDEDIFSFGSAVLRGKYELYDNFPLNREHGGDVEFYFNVYNILGDPSLMMWTKVPQEINCTLPEEVSIGTNYLEVSLPDMDGAIVTAIKDDEFYAVDVIENSQALLYLDSQTAGEIFITISKPNYHPLIDTINVVTSNIDVSLIDVDTGGAVVSGEDVQLSLTLKNFGSQTANSVSADLSSANPFVNIVTTTANYGNIAAGGTASQNYDVEVLAACPDNSIIELSLDISTGSTSKFEFIVSGLILEVSDVTVNDENGVLDPSEESDVTVTIENIGTFDAIGLQAELVSLSSDVAITSSQYNIGNINMDETGTADFSVLVSADCYVGKNIPFRVDIEDDNSLQSSVYFNLEVGQIENTAPTGPDSYGYYAYDSYDVYYENCPEYFWKELDPLEGGDGTVLQIGDDVSRTIEMPFDFPFYGEISDSITICSNGWISIQPTWETYFRNWNIPSALGPYGMIAAYWDDLIGFPLADDEHAKMRICYDYIEDENIFVIEWNKCINNFDEVSIEKFELILYDPDSYPTTDGNGEIQFNYHTVNNPDVNSNYSTVGIENLTQSDGLLYTYASIYPASATQLCNNLAIKFSTDPPEFIEETTPVAEFSADITYGIAPLEINFVNQTSPLSYFGTLEWQFGDDSSNSSEINPVHTYQEVGGYSVTLTATNSQGTDSITHDDFITVFPSENLIWPGDTNIDGSVNEDDIIPIGIYWQQRGDPRSSISFNWEGNDYPGEWEKPMASLADCNGDGLVNITDILGICLNWNSTHSVAMCIPPDADDITEYRENFVEIYNSLGNSGVELLLKNHIAERFDLPIIEPVQVSSLSQ